MESLRLVIAPVMPMNPYVDPDLLPFDVMEVDLSLVIAFCFKFGFPVSTQTANWGVWCPGLLICMFDLC